MNRSTLKRTFTVVVLLALGAAIVAFLSKESPPREFVFERYSNLITAYPTDGGYVNESEKDIARSQWKEKFGTFGQPGRFTRVLRDGRGLAFAIHQD